MSTIEMLAAVKDRRTSLLAAGYHVVPVTTAGKRPVGFGWQKVAKQQTSVSPISANALNTGILCDGLRAIDIDIDDQDVCDRVAKVVLDHLGPAPERFRDNSPRRLFVYRAAEGEPGKRVVKGEFGKVEVLGRGQQFVAFGDHDSGASIQWRSTALDDVLLLELPAVDETQIDQLLEDIGNVIGAGPQAQRQPASHSILYTRTSSMAELEELLTYLDASCGYEDWVRVLMAIHEETGGSMEGLALADHWSSRGGKLYPGYAEIEKKWRSFHRSGGVTRATIAAMAEQAGADLASISFRHNSPDYDDAEARDVAHRLWKHFEQKAGIQSNEKVDPETGEVFDQDDDMPAPLAKSGDWSHPGGVIEDIADWIVETSSLPNRRLALAAAISFVATICSRHIASPTLSGLQLYTICTGQTGIGKDWPMKAIERLAMETGTQFLIQSGKVTTSLAIENSIAQNPTQLIISDEVGRRIFGKAGHKRASSYETAILDTLLELWSCNPITVYRTTRRVDSAAAVIEAPAVSLFGVSTHVDFYSSLGRAAIDNGMLNRMLIIEADPRAQIRDIDGDMARKPPDHIIDAIIDLKPSNDPSPGSKGTDLATGIQAYMMPVRINYKSVPWANGKAKAIWQRFRMEMLEVSDMDEEVAPFISRAAEMTTRLATLWALSKFGQKAAMVTEEAVEWAIALVRESVSNAMDGAKQHIVSSEFQEHARRVEKIVKEKGRAPISVVARRMGNVIDNRALNSVIDSLVMSGKVEKEPGHGGTRLRWLG